MDAVEKLAMFKSMKIRHDIPAVLNALGLTGNGVEVGVAEGFYAEVLLEKWPGHLYLVDAWKHNTAPACTRYYWNFSDEKYQIMLEGCEKLLSRFADRCTFRRGWSLEMAATFADQFFDFIYIDASHFYEDISADLAAWYPKLKPGGVIAGHDYIPNTLHFGVRRAVDEFADSHGYNVHVILDKPELHPSWFIYTGH